MQVVQGVTTLDRALNAPVVAIGNFDGVHRGHQHLFAAARRLAAGGELVVLTFEPHPVRLLRPDLAPPLIVPLSRKLELIAAAGADVAVVEPFTPALAALTPEAFFETVLLRGLSATGVCVGYDFTFGRKRAGDTGRLAELCRAHGLRVEVVPAFSVEGMVCSSTKVREFVLEGRVEGAALLLGRDPEVEGEVARGAARGKKLGFPTANLRPAGELVPKNGVYAGWAELPGEPGRWGAAINVGTNPTFSGNDNISVEAHLLDAKLDLYGRRLRVGFTRRLREERRFPSVEALVEQIASDVAAARRIYGESGRGGDER
jgi:riboflavin kinase/FMN adenylyltransferase